MRAVLVLVGLAALCAAGACGGSPSSDTPTPPVSASPSADDGSAIPDATKTLVRDMVDGGLVPGLVIGVVGPRGREYFAYGTTELAGGDPVDEDTVFEIGSIGKVFTTTLLMDMAQHGELALDDPIERYLPASVKAPTYRRRSISLGDLASHTSGLPILPDNLTPADELNPYADYSVRRLYAALSHTDLTCKPGTCYEYSNLGMGLLGHILCLRSGTGYEELVVNRITDDLGMTDTRVTLTPGMQRRLATGYRDGSAMPLWDNPTLAGAGALRSTARDMLTFLAATAGVIDSPLTSALRATYVPRVVVDPSMRIGLGWHILTTGGVRTVESHGATGGYWAFLGFHQKARTGVVVLTNAYLDVDGIGRAVLSEAASE